MTIKPEGISDLIGKTLVRAEVVRDKGQDIVHFETSDEKWMMWYEPDCCAWCNIEDIVGDINDLVGSPILMAERTTNHDLPNRTYDTSFTWTFYKLATAKGYVTIRWYGSSNGYYSETASFTKLHKK